MKRYKIYAEYKALVELEIEIDDNGVDPMDPKHWDKIESEQQLDYSLWDVLNAKEVDEF